LAQSKPKKSKAKSRKATKAPLIKAKGRKVVGRLSFKTYARMRPKNAWAAAVAPASRLTVQEWDAWVIKQLQSKA
jgi:hypothetical protein